jgi:hypothetical protein
MKFFLDEMLPHQAGRILAGLGHDATSPEELHKRELPDPEIVRLCASEGWVIVTENWEDFAEVRTCTVVLVIKGWWPGQTLAHRLATALDRWAAANPEPGNWARWLDANLR